MEPFSITAGCVGLLASIAGLSKQIGTFVGDVRGSRKDMEAVSRELASLNICLEMLCTDCDNPAVRYPEGLQESLANMLRNCQGVTTEMGDLIRKMSSDHFGRKLQWAVTAKNDVNNLRSRLEAHRGALDIALDMLQILLIREVKQDTEDILDDTHAIRQDTSRLRKVQEDVSQIPKLLEEIAMLKLQVESLASPETQENILIQRFLDDTASYTDKGSHDAMSHMDDGPFQPFENAWLNSSPDLPDERARRPYVQAVDNEALKEENDVNGLPDLMSLGLGRRDPVQQMSRDEIFPVGLSNQPIKNPVGQISRKKVPPRAPNTAIKTPKREIQGRVTPQEARVIQQSLAPLISNPTPRAPLADPDLQSNLSCTWTRHGSDYRAFKWGFYDPMARPYFSSISSEDGKIYGIGSPMQDLSVFKHRDGIFSHHRITTAKPLSNTLDKFSLPSSASLAELYVENYFIIWGGGVVGLQGNVSVQSLYLLNITTLKWSKSLAKGTLPLGRMGHTLTSIGTIIYLFGGYTGSVYLNGLFSFDLEKAQTGRFSWEKHLENRRPLQPAPSARSFHSMVNFGESLYLFGGKNEENYCNDIWSYDPRSNKWSKLICGGDVPSPRSSHSAVVVGDIMYIFGGYNRSQRCLGDLYALRILERRWYIIEGAGDPPLPRSDHLMTVWENRIVILGGHTTLKGVGAEDSTDSLHSIYTFDIAMVKLKRFQHP